MKIPEWAKSADVPDKMRREVLRFMRRVSKPSEIVHCTCGRGCKRCYGEPHCGCRSDMQITLAFLVSVLFGTFLKLFNVKHVPTVDFI